MGKPSSSSKKKRSKNPSKTRARKRGRSESKRYKSTASHRRDYQISSDDDCDSRSLVSKSSSSSEDDYVSRRSRSHVRKDVKSSRSRSRVRKDVKTSKRKRNRRRSSSNESCRETSPVRRQKRSKKNVNFEARKKMQKKKFRRDGSTSSMSNDSCSCSDCQCESSSSDESKIERHAGRSKRKEKSKRKLGRIKGGSKRKIYRSRSCSTGSGFSGSTDYQDEKNWTAENNSRRLRSVITFPKEDKEGREFVKIDNNEEMVYDHDDYPSCKSNDSNDGGSKKDLPHSSCVESEKKNAIDDGKIEETMVSSNQTFDVTGGRKDDEAHYYRSIHSPDRIGTTDAVNERNNEALNSVGNASADDLESVLRQRALENLKKFRGGLQTIAKTPIDEKIQSASIPIVKAELRQTNAPDDQGAKVNAALKSVAVGSATVLRRDTAHSSENEEKNSDRFNAGNESGSAKQDSALVTDHTIEKASTASAVTNKPKLATSDLRKVSSNVNSPHKRVNVSGNPPGEKMVIESGAVNCASETVQAVNIQSVKNNGDTFNKASGSASVLPSPSLEPVAGNVISNNLQEQTTEGSQLERKTMSVMRGGEMVEVSYKVYIPKKTPALARRPLKR
ncbi:hypothetical protein HS088_TW21G00439 [Tripterygium wilfordii]|uniref:Uncharacterized protein n=1 Tax=Tripterygium wilfordii TaxID=458696 RepID=A0A7J7C2D6_TRIWF|nr:uncharacterized protein DDB_G0287625 [Tripterygium wilfordii]KAF5728292.1 hypothetical protein HS088_TW21G00439 [Tripterygium wilfordii]